MTDRDGNPIQGAVVGYSPKANPTMVYKGKTNKKGKYFVSGLFTPKENDMWLVSVEYAEHIPVHVRIESRSVNKVLIGDVIDSKLSYGTKVPEIMIRPLGKVRTDLKLAPEADVLAEQQVQVQQQNAVADAAAAAAAGGDAAAAATATPQRDPWAEALTAAQNGNLEVAVPLFEEAIEKEPEDAERHAVHAKVLFELERYEDAAAAAQAAIDLDPQRMDVRRVLSSVQIEEGDLDGAMETIDAALAVSPGDVNLLERKAYVSTEMGDDAGAIAAYESIAEEQPGNVNAWVALGGLYADAGDTAKSEAAYQKVADLNPADAYQTFYNLGAVIMTRNDRNDADTRRAIDSFRKAIEIKPDYAQAYQQMAFALIGLGERDEALAALEDFVRVAPNSPDAARMKGLIATLKKTP